jgi:hypothetical protein
MGCTAHVLTRYFAQLQKIDRVVADISKPSEFALKAANHEYQRRGREFAVGGRRWATAKSGSSSHKNTRQKAAVRDLR